MHPSERILPCQTQESIIPMQKHGTELKQMGDVPLSIETGEHKRKKEIKKINTIIILQKPSDLSYLSHTLQKNNIPKQQIDYYGVMYKNHDDALCKINSTWYLYGKEQTPETLCDLTLSNLTLPSGIFMVPKQNVFAARQFRWKKLDIQPDTRFLFLIYEPDDLLLIQRYIDLTGIRPEQCQHAIIRYPIANELEKIMATPIPFPEAWQSYKESLKLALPRMTQHITTLRQLMTLLHLTKSEFTEHFKIPEKYVTNEIETKKRCPDDIRERIIHQIQSESIETIQRQYRR